MSGTIEVMGYAVGLEQGNEDAAGVGPTVSVVVVSYNNENDIEACLASVRRALVGLDGEVVVVDNGSGDRTVEVVRAADPGALVVERENDGFARGCHAGAVRARGRYLLFVNPDAVIGAGAVAALLTEAQVHPEAALFGGRALRHDGSTDPRSWWGRPTLWSTFCFATGLSSAFPGHRLLDPESSDRWDGSAREVPVVSGALLLVRRPVWDELGGFDRTFLLYGEDVDLSLRARAAGWRARVVPAATFTHAVGASTPGPGRTSLVLRGRASVLRRHLLPGTRRLGVGLLVAGTGLRALAAQAVAVRRRGGRASVTAPGAWRAAWAARRTWSQGWQDGDQLGQASTSKRTGT